MRAQTRNGHGALKLADLSIIGIAALLYGSKFVRELQGSVFK